MVDAGARPCEAAICRRHRGAQTKPAGHFDPQCKGRKQVLPGDRAMFSQCQYRGGDWSGGMHHRRFMGVIKAVDARRQPVDQRGMQDVGLLTAPEQRRLRRSGKCPKCPIRDLNHFMPRAANGAADHIEQRTQCLTVNRIGPARCVCVDREIRQPRGDLFRCECHDDAFRSE